MEIPDWIKIITTKKVQLHNLPLEMMDIVFSSYVTHTSGSDTTNVFSECYSKNSLC